jgi:hypothetical protein
LAIEVFKKDFGRIQIDRIKEMKKVARDFKTRINQENISPVKFAIVAANNHYAGFGPGTVNIFRQLLGLEEIKWRNEYLVTDDLERKYDDKSANRAVIKTKQTNLSDFL